jgi:uncharacterized protein YndB with AHSA1/START domain
VNTSKSDTVCVIVERDLECPPEKVWRALTQPHLIQEWLMKNDFLPVVGHRFKLSEDWGSIDCRVLEIEPQRRLAYTWEAFKVETVVTFTLTVTVTGTHLRVVQDGFLAAPEHRRFVAGAQHGWSSFLGKLDLLLAGVV